MRSVRRRSLTGPFLGVYAVKMIVLGAVFLFLLVMLIHFHDDDRRAHDATQTLIETLTAQQTVTNLDEALRIHRYEPTIPHAKRVARLEGRLYTSIAKIRTGANQTQ